MSEPPSRNTDNWTSHALSSMSTELPSRENALTAFHQAAFDDPMRPLLYGYASGRLVDREAIDHEAADRAYYDALNEDKTFMEAFRVAVAAALGDIK